MNQSKTNYPSANQDFRALKTQLDEYDGGFYRMELTNLRTRMDPSWYNYNGVSVFSTKAYEKTANLQSDVGLFSNYINSYTYNLQTPVYNAMFGLKYIVDNDNNNMSTQFYRRLFSTDGFIAYENLYDLPVAFACNSAVASWDAGATKDPFAAQENWFAAATGIPSVFERLNVDYISYNNIAEFFEGEVEKGLDIVRTCRNRYDGRVRNPFNEYECGAWYARAMSSYAMLQALTGIRYDAVDSTLHIDSKIGNNFTSFLSTNTGFGNVGLKNGKPFIEVKYGNINIQKCIVAGKEADIINQ